MPTPSLNCSSGFQRGSLAGIKFRIIKSYISSHSVLRRLGPARSAVQQQGANLAQVLVLSDCVDGGEEELRVEGEGDSVLGFAGEEGGRGREGKGED